MKTLLRIVAAALILLQLVTVLTAAVVFAEGEDAPATPSMTVYATDMASMSLDGKVTRGEAWDKAEWSDTEFKQIGSEKVPAGSGIRFKVLWGKQDENAYLWFLIDVNDNILNATGRAWNQDNVRIFLDEDGVGEDSAKPKRDQENYGSIYASSEFMSYAPNGYSSKGFAYAATKKEDESGYFVEVRYTYQNPALAVAEAALRANLTVVFADENNEKCAQFLWSWNAEKWSSGFADKEFFAHAGTLVLSGDTVVSDDKKPDVPLTPSKTISAKQTTVDALKIDGKVDETEVWNQVDWSEDAVAYHKASIATEGSEDYQEIYKSYGFRFKVLWATDGKKAYLYFLIDVSDPNMTSTKRAWASDNVRVFVDETGIAPGGTVAKRDRESAYASSEFMSYATVENSLGFKYRSKQKADGSGYLVEVQYTLSDKSLAVAGAAMKLNVVANDADSANDDGNHFAQQFAWSWNSDIWDAYTQIDCIEHAGQLTLSEELVKPEEQITTTGEGEDTGSQPTDSSGQDTNSQPTPAESGSETDPAQEPDNKGCRSSVGAGLLFLLPAAAIPMFRRKRNDD